MHIAIGAQVIPHNLAEIIDRGGMGPVTLDRVRIIDSGKDTVDIEETLGLPCGVDITPNDMPVIINAGCGGPTLDGIRIINRGVSTVEIKPKGAYDLAEIIDPAR
jgi:hypothetical protein